MNNERHTVNELIPAIGARVLVRCESLLVECTVRDAKNSYGRVRLLVVPVSGFQSQWVELSRLVMMPEFSNSNGNGMVKQ